MLAEVWMSVIGYEPFYQVSNLGNIRSLPRKVCDSAGREYIRKERFVKQFECHKGYLRVALTGTDGKQKRLYVHRLVASAFIGFSEFKQVNHIDFNRKNNIVTNLEWVTCKENISHSVINGRNAFGERIHTSVLSPESVEFIRRNYIPRDKKFGARAMAKKFGVYHSAITKVIHNITWKHDLLKNKKDILPLIEREKAG